jgi:hypothetical protein
VTHVECFAAQLRWRHQRFHVFSYKGHIDANSGLERTHEIGSLDKLAFARRGAHDAIKRRAPPCVDRNKLIASVVGQRAGGAPDVAQGPDPAAFQRPALD